MTRDEFERILDETVVGMGHAIRAGKPGFESHDEFEESLLVALTFACEGNATATPARQPTAFPDIVVNGFGVDAKFSRGSSWHGTGNSILESTLDKRAQSLYIVFCRTDIREIRWSRYEDAISGVRVSHSPRYMINMEGRNKFF